jgi:hypothetical protein
MKSFLAVVLAGLLWATAAVAREPVTVQSAEVVDYGVYKIDITGEPPTPGLVLVSGSDQVPATLGTAFGFHFILKGKPVGAMADVDIVVEHPPFKNKPGGTGATLDRNPWRYKIGEKAGFVYSLDYEWEAVPGKWAIEVWQGGTRLAGRIFFLKPKDR